MQTNTETAYLNPVSFRVGLANAFVRNVQPRERGTRELRVGVEVAMAMNR